MFYCQLLIRRSRRFASGVFVVFYLVSILGSFQIVEFYCSAFLSVESAGSSPENCHVLVLHVNLCCLFLESSRLFFPTKLVPLQDFGRWLFSGGGPWFGFERA